MDSFDVVSHYKELTAQVLARDQLVGSLFSHGTLVGDHAEAIVRDLLRARLPPNVAVDAGQIVATNGNLSPQTDVVIYKDTQGARIGESEGGAKLIRMDHVIGVVEVKRSIGRGTVGKMQGYAQAIRSTFVAGDRRGSWIQWGIAFRTTKTQQTILSELDEAYDGNDSLGLILVLDVQRTAKELKGLFPPSTVKRKVPTGGSLGQFLAAALVPNALLFGRTDSGYQVIDQGRPALLEFMIELEAKLSRTHIGPTGNPGIADFL